MPKSKKTEQKKEEAPAKTQPKVKKKNVKKGKEQKKAPVKSLKVGNRVVTGEVHGDVLTTPEGVSYGYSPDREV